MMRPIFPPLFDCCVAAHNELLWRWAEARESVELGQVSCWLTAHHCARRSFVVTLSVIMLIVALCDCHCALHEKGGDPGLWAEAKKSVEFGQVSSRSLISSRSSIACCRARLSLVVALIDCLSPRSLITRRASPCALRAKGVDSGRWALAGESVEFGRGVRRGGRKQWCGRITRCGGCGGGEGAALRGPMVNGVKRERLREGHQLQTMGGIMGGRRVWPRRAGWKYLW
jgi:hypothetical protein